VATEIESIRGRLTPDTTPRSAPHVVITADPRARDPLGVAAPKTAWRALGWFGALLVVIGATDAVSQWYPPSFHSHEWQFGTAVITIASLPLLTMGVMAMLASVLARAQREGAIAVGVIFTTLFLAVGGILVLFALNVPIELQSPPDALAAINRAIVRTAIMGTAYELAYFAAAVLAFRYALGRVRDR
jgi:hypothetical protein